MSAEDRLRELGIELPPPPEPVGNYIRVKQVGSLLFVSGHGPVRDAAGNQARGKVGRDLTLDEGYQAARSVGINLLATLRYELGSLNRVKQVVRLLGMVNCAPGFVQTPQVMNGCSDLLVDVFGDAGRHTRAAVGMAELPNNIAVEVEMVAEVE